jgi:hypothetical protein
MKSIRAFQLSKHAVHPFVFAVFPVASLYLGNLNQGFLREAVSIAAAVTLGVGILWLLLHLVIRNAQKSAIIVSSFLVLFFTFGHAKSAVATVFSRLQLSGQVEALVRGEFSYTFWLIATGALLGAVIICVLRTSRDLGVVTQFLNVVGLALLLMMGANAAVGGLKATVVPLLRANEDNAALSSVSPSSNAATGEARHRMLLPMVSSGDPEDSLRADEFVSSWQEQVFSSPLAPTASGIPPDIYYIIVDAYAREDILEEVFEFDNSEFISYLGERGFYVADKSRANYPQTALSLASTLNFVYLDELVEQVGTQTDNRGPLSAMISDNRVFEFLRANGYRILTFASGYAPTNLTNADEYLAPKLWWDLSEFQEALVALTPLSASRRTLSDARRQRISYTFDHLPDVAGMEGPTFTFAHITAPHFPFIFDAEGKPIHPRQGIGSRSDYDYDEYVQGYTGQLLYINSRLRETIDEIVAQSEVPPIIVLQSDHGSSARLDSSWSLEHTYLPERLSILNAYYFADKGYEDLYQEITPVNTFRVILNKYFGAGFPMVEDRSYWSSWGTPYLLTDVTETSQVSD